MPTFVYTAYDRTGKKVRGAVEASNETQAVTELSQKGFVVVDIKMSKSDKVKIRKKRRIFTIPLVELAVFSRQFSTMVSAGIRIRDALEILSEQIVFSRRFRNILKEIVQLLIEGRSLSEALEEVGAFEPIFVNLVKAGEEGGVLDTTMEKVADFYESSKELQDEVKASMRYPMFIMGFAVIVVIGISIFVIPNMVRTLGFHPTGAVGFLMKLNELLSGNWHIVSIVVIALAILMRVFMSTFAGKRFKEIVSGLFPPVKKLSNQMVVERFARTLGILVGAGVNLTVALEMAADATASARFMKRMDEVVRLVKEGLTLRDALARTKLVPQLVYEMVGTGEMTGKLDEVLSRVADFYEAQIRIGVKKLVSIIEPVMIVIIGAFVAFIAYSLYSTMFQAETSFGGM